MVFELQNAFTMVIMFGFNRLVIIGGLGQMCKLLATYVTELLQYVKLPEAFGDFGWPSFGRKAGTGLFTLLVIVGDGP